MAETQKTDQESPNPTTQRSAGATYGAAFALLISCLSVTFWAIKSARRGTGSVCSTVGARGQLDCLLIRGLCCAYLLYLHNIWADDQNKQYHAVRRHILAQSTEPLRTPRYFWLLPHIQSPLRRSLAILASMLIVLLQLLALRFSYQGVWATSVSVLENTIYRGTCVNGELVLDHSLVRWCLGTVALLCTVCAWVPVIMWTLLWLIVQVPYLSCLCVNSIRWQRKDADSADQCEKAACSINSDDTKP